jgi:hypothetical protein
VYASPEYPLVTSSNNLAAIGTGSRLATIVTVRRLPAAMTRRRADLPAFADRETQPAIS